LIVSLPPQIICDRQPAALVAAEVSLCDAFFIEIKASFDKIPSYL
jgi:hypothetical protein